MRRFTFLRLLLWATAMAVSPQVNSRATADEAEPSTDAASTDDENDALSVDGAAGTRAVEVEAQLYDIQT